MSQLSSGKTVLIIDDDLGFVLWLGQVFHEMGYHPIPALNARQAGRLTKELDLKIAVVVVNSQLPGVGRLIDALSHANSAPLKIILIRDPDASATISIRAHAILDRPSGWEPVSQNVWLRRLYRVLKQTEETDAIPKIIG